MNEKKEFLNEENYQKTRKKISKIILTVFIVGILLGVSLIAVGIVKRGEVNSKYSDESKVTIQEQLSQEKIKLEEKQKELENNRTTNLETEKASLLQSKSELEAKIKPVEDEIKSLERVKFTGFNDAYYAREDKKLIEIIDDALDESFNHCAFDETKNNSYTSKYCSIKNNQTDDLKNISVIKKALDESFNYCRFDETKNNALTSNYCSLKLQLNDLNEVFGKSFESTKSIPFFIFGVFVIIGSCTICGSLYLSLVKRREIMAYGAQQVMPVAQEGIEKMAPTIGKAGASIVKEMAPVYGDIAKEVSKGIKDGLKEKKQDDEK